jgi:hypothetical protein
MRLEFNNDQTKNLNKELENGIMFVHVSINLLKLKTLTICFLAGFTQGILNTCDGRFVHF